MLKRSFLALCVVALAGCSNSAPSAPSESQVKQALYDFYGTTSAGNELKQALAKDVSVKDCQKAGDAYRCNIENKALGTSIPMLFVFDKSTDKWKFDKEISK